jgi:four helix bundle protein
MNNVENKEFGLQERTLQFAKKCRVLINRIPKNINNIEDGKQLSRSSGSVGANFIESIESLSKKDSIYRLKICRKKAKESRYWLNLINTGNLEDLEFGRKALIQEATELMNIFGSIIRKKEL